MVRMGYLGRGRHMCLIRFERGVCHCPTCQKIWCADGMCGKPGERGNNMYHICKYPNGSKLRRWQWPRFDHLETWCGLARRAEDRRGMKWQKGRLVAYDTRKMGTAETTAAQDGRPKQLHNMDRATSVPRTAGRYCDIRCPDKFHGKLRKPEFL